MKKLDSFTLNIEYGFEKGVLVIQGESGAGKTTILNCISGLTTPDEGRIEYDSTVVFDSCRSINLPAKNRSIGYLFQSYALFPNMTVMDNICYGLRNKPEYKDKKKREALISYAEYVMNTFGIYHLKRKYPNSISGGEKQRTAFARAIAAKPKLLLLDEPFSALDEDTKEIIYKEFKHIKDFFQTPAILITHSLAEGEMFANQRIVLKHGRISKEAKAAV
jgi:molybdate transport system ATP-binding protein